jgi:hypothetical protein
MASRFIERLRGKIPFVHRLHREIDDLRCRLAVAEQQPSATGTAQTEPRHAGQEFRAFLALLQPHDVRGRNKVRVGAEADGGYVMLDDLVPTRHALSLGIGTQVSWDIAMAARGLRVFQYDHTVDASPQLHELFVFHRARVVAQTRGPQEITLADIVASPALDGDTDIVAKIDIEGDEWKVLATTGREVLARIRQIAIEFHSTRSFSEAEWRKNAFAALRNLTSTHCCIHVHGNNWDSFAVVGGVPFPDTFEATFVRRSDHATVPSALIFPTEIDRPCNPRKPDLYLGRWNY